MSCLFLLFVCCCFFVVFCLFVVVVFLFCFVFFFVFFFGGGVVILIFCCFVMVFFWLVLDALDLVRNTKRNSEQTEYVHVRDRKAANHKKRLMGCDICAILPHS